MSGCPSSCSPRAAAGGHAGGLLASNPLHLGGAIDGDAADKATAFLDLCQVLSTAAAFEIDDVIDPADTRAVLTGVLARARPVLVLRSNRGKLLLETSVTLAHCTKPR
ncbi:MAG: hypothetical protein ACRDOH_35215 [Streptosporangiaceae bacterium]